MWGSLRRKSSWSWEHMHLTLRISTFLLIIGACPLVHGLGNTNREVMVAHRYDATRVVFDVDVQDRQISSYRDVTIKKLPEPEARLTALKLFEPSGTTIEKSADSIVGRTYALLLGREKSIDITVDQVVPANLMCGGAAVAIASVAPEDLEQFTQTREKYYLVTSTLPDVRSSLSLGLDWTSLDDASADRIRRVLEDIFSEELESVISKSKPTHDRIIAYGHKWPFRWRKFDKALKNGEGEASL